MSATNIDYEEQSDDTVIIRPSDQMQVEGLLMDEEGMTVTFSREQAQIREDAQYITMEHPFTQSLFEMVHSQSFGNTNVAVLRSNAIPQGSLLIEMWFRVEVIAPKVLNLAASLPQQLIRVLLNEKGQDLTPKINSAMLQPYTHYLDMNNARHVVKLRRDVIEERYKQAEQTAKAQVQGFSEVARQRYHDRLQQEIDRLTYLKAHNPSIRDDEVQSLKDQQQQGVALLQQLSLVPDAIRVLVAMKG